jgi:hypothetical protein
MSNQNPKTPLELLQEEADRNANTLLGSNGAVQLDLVCHVSSLATKKGIPFAEALALVIEAAGTLAATRGKTLAVAEGLFKKGYELGELRVKSSRS